MFLRRLLAPGKRINVLGSKNTISISLVATNEFYSEILIPNIRRTSYFIVASFLKSEFLQPEALNQELKADAGLFYYCGCSFQLKSFSVKSFRANDPYKSSIVLQLISYSSIPPLCHIGSFKNQSSPAVIN